MPEYRNWSEANHQFTTMQKSFFTEMEEKLKRPIYVVNGTGPGIAGHPVRPKDAPKNALVIHDFQVPQGCLHTPANANKIHGPKQGQVLDLEKFPFSYKYPAKVPASRLIHFTMPDKEQQPLGGYAELEVMTCVSLVNFTKTQLKEFQLDKIFELACDAEKIEADKSKRYDQAIKTAAQSLESAANLEADTVRNKISQFENEVAQQNAQAIQSHRSMQQEKLKLDMLEQMRTDETDNFTSELEELGKNINIRDIHFTKGDPGLEAESRLEVWTNQMYLYSPTAKERVPLGFMRISLYTNGRIIIVNETNVKGNPPKPHPHVSSQGDACWGGIQSQIVKLVGQFNLVALFETIFAYLENYHPEDDYARFAPYWFDTQEIEHLQEDGSYLTETELQLIENQKQAVLDKKETKKPQDEVVAS